MNKQLSIEAYRAIDILLWVAILCVFEGAIIRVSASFLFYDQMFTVSLAAGITALVCMRWGWWGMIHAAVAGFVYCLLNGGAMWQYAVYIIGNCFAATMVPVLKKKGTENLRSNTLMCLAWGAGIQAMMHLGRGIVSLFFGAGFSALGLFFTTDPLSYVFTMVIIWIVRRVDGVF